jgi:hypothetical protein
MIEEKFYYCDTPESEEKDPRDGGRGGGTTVDINH